MSGDTVARIEKLENGWEVEICDPEQQAKNADPKNKKWEDPWKGYAFSTDSEVIAFLTKKLAELNPAVDSDTEYSQSFAAAANEDN